MAVQTGFLHTKIRKGGAQNTRARVPAMRQGPALRPIDLQQADSLGLTSEKSGLPDFLDMPTLHIQLVRQTGTCRKPY
jgi:hypothetical protein